MILTLNEQLLRDTKNANICIFIANLAGWLRTNIEREKFSQRNIRDGQCWSYNSLKDLQNYFDFWSIKTLRTIISHCERLGLIIIGDFNKHKYDKTSWYTLTDKALSYYPVLRDKICTRSSEASASTDLPKTANGFAQNGTPIPEDLNSLSNINITISNQEVIDCYHEHLPELTKIKVVDRDLNNKINSMKKNWPKYQKDGKAFSISLFVDFLQFIKNHHSWFLKPRITEGGNIRKNSLRNLIAEINLARFANGEFSAS